MTDRWTDPELNIPVTETDELVLRIFEDKPVAILDYRVWHQTDIIAEALREYGIQVLSYLGKDSSKTDRLSNVDLERRYCDMELFPKYTMTLMFDGNHKWVYLEHWPEQTTITSDGRSWWAKEKIKSGQEDNQARLQLFEEGLRIIGQGTSNFEIHRPSRV